MNSSSPSLGRILKPPYVKLGVVYHPLIRTFLCMFTPFFFILSEDLVPHGSRFCIQLFYGSRSFLYFPKHKCSLPYILTPLTSPVWTALRYILPFKAIQSLRSLICDRYGYVDRTFVKSCISFLNFHFTSSSPSSQTLSLPCK